jgi:type III pantothenate kinase
MKIKRTLLFDIGNTFIKWGLLDELKLVDLGCIRNEDFLAKECDALIKLIPPDAGRVIACCVASNNIDAKLTTLISNNYDCLIEYVQSESMAYGIRSGYQDASQLGVDRWVAMIAAKTQFSGDITVIDLGTAITIDTIDEYGDHIGGQILPGLQLMLSSLDKKTDRITLPSISNDLTNMKINFWADNTNDAIIFGACNAICGAIERAIICLQENGHSPTVILTGGDALVFKNLMNEGYRHRPNLVLEGLAIIANS